MAERAQAVQDWPVVARHLREVRVDMHGCGLREPVDRGLQSPVCISTVLSVARSGATLPASGAALAAEPPAPRTKTPETFVKTTSPLSSLVSVSMVMRAPLTLS